VTVVVVQTIGVVVGGGEGAVPYFKVVVRVHGHSVTVMVSEAVAVYVLVPTVNEVAEGQTVV
jgi:hypothetical protein